MSRDAFVDVELTNGDAGFPLSPTCDRYQTCNYASISLFTPRPNIDFSSPSVGSFLIAVPEPASIAVLGIGLLAFVKLRRKT